jgi:phage antirepressor YoqD-like protein
MRKGETIKKKIPKRKIAKIVSVSNNNFRNFLIENTFLIGVDN